MLKVGDRLRDRYEIDGVLGEGGMGVVYRAYDRVQRTRVALKTVRRSDGQTLYRFKAEFRALADVQHPHLVRLDELDTEDEPRFFTMECIDGVDLTTYVRRGGTRATQCPAELSSPASANATMAVAMDPLPPAVELSIVSCRRPDSPDVWPHGFDEARVRGAMCDIVEGLDHLHQRGRLHCDVKPSNILADARGLRIIVCRCSGRL